MTATKSVKDQDWFRSPSLHRVFELFNCDGQEIRIAGGAVRNALMGLDIGDVDLATTWLPENVKVRAEKNGFKAIPTGLEHGTVTLVVDGDVFEVTTLRHDIDTDGRHAKVQYGADWAEDAKRRDLTINGLYADSEGNIIDHVGGIADIESRHVRFIGDAETRIQEDYLRILRFFRFFAHYGEGRPDADGLKACARNAKGLATLSVERIWKELRLLLSASDPSRALLWMRTTGILTTILPDTEKWGIDSVGPLISTRRERDWQIDPLLILESIVPPNVDRIEKLTKRMKMSKVEALRLHEWVRTPKVPFDMAEVALDRALYKGSVSGYKDVLKLSLVASRSRAQTDDAAIHEVAGFSKLLRRLERWHRPQFPVSGKDLQSLGIESGKQMGDVLKQLEDAWINSNFSLSKEKLLQRL